MITLKNKTKTIKVYNLDHKSYCTDQECSCSRMTMPMQEALGDGMFGVRHVQRNICASVTILAGATVELPDRAEKVAAIRTDLDRGLLLLVKHPERPAKPAEAPPVLPPTEPATQPGGKRQQKQKSTREPEGS